MRLKVALPITSAVLCVALLATACSDDTSSGPPPGSVIDLYDPCTLVSSVLINELVGFTMFRETPTLENADRFRSCRWTASPDNTDLESIDYLDVGPRPYIDVILRQTGVDDEAGVDVVFNEVRAATNTRPEPALVTTADTPRLADEALRTDTTAWAIKGNRMLIIATSDEAFLDALIEAVSGPLLQRL